MPMVDLCQLPDDAFLKSIGHYTDEKGYLFSVYLEKLKSRIYKSKYFCCVHTASETKKNMYMFGKDLVMHNSTTYMPGCFSIFSSTSGTRTSTKDKIESVLQNKNIVYLYVEGYIKNVKEAKYFIRVLYSFLSKYYDNLVICFDVVYSGYNEIFKSMNKSGYIKKIKSKNGMLNFYSFEKRKE